MEQSLNHHTQILGGSSTPQEDLGPLAWVLDEVKTSVEVASRALKQFASDASIAAGTDLASLDDTQLRLAGQQLHQAMGALTMVGLEKPSKLLLQMNTVIQRFLSKPELCTPDAAIVLDKAGYALTFYLESYLSGRKMSAIALFPQYADVSELAEDRLAHPSQLWEHEWKWLDIDDAGGAGASQVRSIDAETRAPMDRWVLQVVRAMDVKAATELRDVALAVSRSPLPRQTIAFWRLAAGYFDAVAQELLASNRYTKRAASQVLMQYLKQMKAPDQVSPDLAHELLFHCAQSPTPDAGSALGRVRAAYALERHIPLDYETVHFGQVDPATVARARKYLTTAKETWSLVSGGELNRLDQITMQFAKLCGLLSELLPSGQGLADALQQCADGVAATRRPPNTTQALEVATAILYVEAVLEDFDLNDPTLPERSRRLCERIQSAQAGSPAEPLESWMEELYRRVSDRQNMGSVVGELKATLAEVEKHMDEYFRNPEDKSCLQDVPHGMSQMRGVLSVLGMEDATQTVLQMREVVENIMVGNASPEALREEGIFERLGNNLGALGFLIDMLSYQPVLARKLFVFDSINGELRPLMGVQKEASEADAEKVGFLPSTVIVGGDEWKDASTLIPDEEAVDGGSGVQGQALTATADDEPEILLEADSQFNPVEATAASAGDGSTGDSASVQPDTHLQTQKVDVGGGAFSDPGATAKLQVADFVPAAEELSLDAADGSESILPLGGADTDTAVATETVVAETPEQVAPGLAAVSAVVEDDDFDQEIFEIFLEEARETVAQARDTIGALRKNPANITDLTNLRRSYHTLKGSGRMVELTEFSEAAWAMEQLFNAWLAESRSATDELLDLAEQSMIGLGDWIEAIDSRTDGSHTAQAYAVSADAMRLDKRFVPLAVHTAGEVQGGQPQDTQAVADALQPVAVSDEAGATDAAVVDDFPTVAEEATGEVADTVEEDAFVQPADAVMQQTVTEKSADDDAVSVPFVQGMSEQAAEAETEVTIESEAVTGGIAEQSVIAPDFDLGADLLSVEREQPEVGSVVEADAADAQDGSVTVTEEVSDEVDFAELSDFDLNLLEEEIEPADAPDLPAAEQQQGSVEGFTEHLSDWGSSDMEVAVGLPVADSDTSVSEADAATATAVSDWQADLGAASDGLSQTAEDADHTEGDEVFLFAGEHDAPAEPADPEGSPDPVLPVLQATAQQVTPEEFPQPQNEVEEADTTDADEYKVIGPLRISIPLFNVYLAEADEWSRKLLDSLNEWAMEAHRLVPEDAISYAHSLAGSSGTIGFLSLSGLARELEHVMERDFQAGSAEFSHEHAACFVAAATAVRSMLQSFAAGELKDTDSSVLASLEAVMAETPPIQETSMGGLGVLDDSMERLRRAEASRKEDWEALVDLDAPVADSGYFANSLRRDAATGSSGGQAAPASAAPVVEPLSQPLVETEEETVEEAAPDVVAAGDSVLAAGSERVTAGEVSESSEPAVTATEAVVQEPSQQVAVTPVQEGESEEDIFTDIWSSESAAVPQQVVVQEGEEKQEKEQAGHMDSTESALEPAQGEPADVADTEPGLPTAAAVLAPVAGATASVAQALPERPDSADAAAGEKKSVLITATDDAHAHDHSDADGLDVEDVLDEDLFPIFEEEAQELIPQLSSGLRDWSSNVGNSEARAQVLRVLHTLKGSARLAGALRMGEMAHNLESVIEAIGSEGVEASQVEPLLEDCDNIVNEFERLRNTDQQEQAAAEARIDSGEPVMASPDPAVAALVEVAAPELTVTDAEAQPQTAVPAAGGVVGLPARRKPSAVRPKSGGQTVRVRSQLLDRILNQTGEVMITRSRLEGGLGQLRASVADLSSNLERLRAQLRDVEVQAETQMQSRMAQNQEAMQTFDPLEFDRFTRMQELTRMMAESVNDVATVQRTIQKTVDATEADLMAQARQTRELQRDLLRTRMVEFDSVSERLYRVVRQSAKETGKSVRLDLFGGRIEMDRGVLDRMTPVFEHLLRNAVAHGIEPGGVRLQAGKEEAGTIGVSVSQDGNDVAIEFRDDGAGLDLEAIKQKALRQGLIDDTTAISDQEAANLVFRSGFSTATDVTRISGRGVGMDVVRSEVNALGGRIETQTVSGQGASFKVVVPLTTAVTQVVMLRAGDVIIGVPASLLEIVRRAAPAQVEEAYTKGNFKHGQDTLPFYWMGALLQSSRATLSEDAKTMSVVVFRSAAQRLAVHVDEVLGNQEVVVKNLGPQLSGMPGLAGMSILPSGSVVLIYNPVALATVYGESVQAYLADQAAVEATASVSVVPLIMVVDDSITVRRITQRFLQREGYRVVLAADGLQALEKLPDETPAVVLSDIEMPRMDGFDLLRNIRANSAYKELPVVMITSRIAEKHREHAISLGANHYLGKPYSEEQLLALVRGYTQQSGQAVAETH